MTNLASAASDFGPVVTPFALRGFAVEVRSDARFFTVYGPAGRIAGTITRPRVYSTGWTAALPDGSPVLPPSGRSTFVGPRTAFGALVRAAGAAAAVAEAAAFDRVAAAAAELAAASDAEAAEAADLTAVLGGLAALGPGPVADGPVSAEFVRGAAVFRIAGRDVSRAEAAAAFLPLARATRAYRAAAADLRRAAEAAAEAETRQAAALAAAAAF